MRQSFGRCSSLVVALVLAPGIVHAGGFEYGTDNGASSVARGGASTALASDMSALYTNVAGAADTPGRADIYLSGNLAFQHLRFQRLPTAGGDTFRPYEDENPIFAGPMLAASIRVLPWMSLVIGANGPAAIGWAHFDHGTAENPGGGRYDLTDMDILYLWPSVGLAIRVPGYEQLRIGAVFQPCFMHMSFTSYANAVSSDQPGTDIRTDLSLWDPFVPAGQLGILYRIWNIELGAQVRLSDNVIEAEGELVATELPFDEENRDERPAVTTKFALGWPLAVLRFGVRYFYPRAGAEQEALPAQREWFDVELDFVYENNEQVDDFVVTPQSPINMSFGDVALPPLHVPHEWNDTFSLRLGGSVNLLGGDLTLSLGVHWESNTVPIEYTRLDYASWMRFGVGAGVTYRVAWFEVTAGYQHIFLPDRTVAADVGDAHALRANAQGGAFEDVVNAGDYSAGLDLLAVSFNFRI